MKSGYHDQEAVLGRAARWDTETRDSSPDPKTDKKMLVERISTTLLKLPSMMESLCQKAMITKFLHKQDAILAEGEGSFFQEMP